MLTQNTHVRDTLIRMDVLNSLPVERQNAINELYNEFKSIHYIDVRTAMGPDQFARESKRQAAKRQDNLCRVFRIEQKIKLLLRTDEQIEADERAKQAQELKDRITKLGYEIRYFETYCSRKISSNRDNATKREYQRLKQELAKLQPAK